ncbi:MAG: PEGA domain-containing protein [Candidatus Zixiibacteriota bacterium]|nr:MAG: PEGA domain-containing protein [candidate division Zixibacteria bacterium]
MNRNLSFLVAIFLLVIAGYNVGFSQQREPITFEGILRLPEFGLDSQQIANQIAESGLAFEVTKAHIDSLQRLGFASSVVNAVRQYYRMGVLKILASPAQVTVYVDNELQGTTDRSGYWEKEIPRGIHEIKLQKDGYADKDSSVTVIKDQTLNVRFTLSGKAVKKPLAYNFYGRYGASISLGLSIIAPKFEEEGKWKGGNNIIFTLKGNVLPYAFVDVDINGANFGDFDPGEGQDFGSLNALSFSVIPGLYKEYKEIYRGYFGLGLEFNSTKIENGKYEGDGVIYVLDEKGSKTSFALLMKFGVDALVQETLFLFAEYRGYSVLGQYSMGFIAIGAGVYVF